jgi:hypothetical protein
MLNHSNLKTTINKLFKTLPIPRGFQLFQAFSMASYIFILYIIAEKFFSQPAIYHDAPEESWQSPIG